MKLIKRILAIVCTFVMIISMATGVNAVENPSTATTGETETGSITIENANKGEKYRIYKILTLESYDKKKELYSYTKNANGNPWNNFIDTKEAKDFLDVNEDGYVTVKEVSDSMAAVRKFATSALIYAREHSIPATKEATAGNESNDSTTTTELKFDGLELGYYLVESSVGAACSITTTDPNVQIQDKHGKPSVAKIITEGGTISGNFRENSVNYGTTVKYETTINLQRNVQNLVLHDMMDSHLTLGSVVQGHVIKKVGTSGTDDNLTEGVDFQVIRNPTDDNCTFEIKFLGNFYQNFGPRFESEELTGIVVTYEAQVSKDALIKTPMKNETYLKYGQNSKTDTSSTTTYTFGIPVYKYTGENTPLAGAKFNLLDTNGNAIKFSRDGDDYSYAIGGSAEFRSHESGKINLKGLQEGKYYLKEIEAPKGYNLLKNPITIEITSKGEIKVNGTLIEDGTVKVKNNTGSLLPHTGGMGTTLIYVVGSILVLASGIVLFSKRKEGTN